MSEKEGNLGGSAPNIRIVHQKGNRKNKVQKREPSTEKGNKQNFKWKEQERQMDVPKKESEIEESKGWAQKSQQWSTEEANGLEAINIEILKK